MHLHICRFCSTTTSSNTFEIGLFLFDILVVVCPNRLVDQPCPSLKLVGVGLAPSPHENSWKIYCYDIYHWYKWLTDINYDVGGMYHSNSYFSTVWVQLYIYIYIHTYTYIFIYHIFIYNAVMNSFPITIMMAELLKTRIITLPSSVRTMQSQWLVAICVTSGTPCTLPKVGRDILSPDNWP